MTDEEMATKLRESGWRVQPPFPRGESILLLCLLLPVVSVITAVGYYWVIPFFGFIFEHAEIASPYWHWRLGTMG